MDVRPPSGGWTIQKTVSDKEYGWCAEITGAPKGMGCDKWVCHPPKEFKGTRKRYINARSQEISKSKQGTKAKPPNKNTRRELQVKLATFLVMDESDSSSDGSADEYPEWLARSD